MLYMFDVSFDWKVRHEISWFDRESSAVGILTSRLESEASIVSGL